jgi:hypothetical protein
MMVRSKLVVPKQMLRSEPIHDPVTVWQTPSALVHQQVRRSRWLQIIQRPLEIGGGAKTNGSSLLASSPQLCSHRLAGHWLGLGQQKSVGRNSPNTRLSISGS